jgi:hypothetical protein
MKKCLFLFAMMFTFSLAIAQKTNLIFFTEGGEKIYVILNAVLQNEKAETNVKVTDLVAPNYKLKILFADSTITPVEKNLMFQQGTETTFNIKKNNKGEYVVRYLSEVPIAQAVPPATGQTVVIFSASGPAMPIAPVATTTVSTTQTTTTTGTTGQDGVSMGVNIGGVSMNMNVNGTGVGPDATSSSTTTTYSTTTTTTANGVGMQTTQVQPQQQAYVLQGYTGAVGCPYPMTPGDFEAAKGTISSKSFDDSKLTIAKQIIATNCLLSSQVRELMQLFSFEDSKLDLAKYAYGYTYDIGNYFKVNDAFTFESSIDELNTYISGIHK